MVLTIVVGALVAVYVLVGIIVCVLLWAEAIEQVRRDE